jgi:hypothetical protein
MGSRNSGGSKWAVYCQNSSNSLKTPINLLRYDAYEDDLTFICCFCLQVRNFETRYVLYCLLPISGCICVRTILIISKAGTVHPSFRSPSLDFAGACHPTFYNSNRLKPCINYTPGIVLRPGCVPEKKNGRK